VVRALANGDKLPQEGTMTFNSVNEILDFAIRKEEEAAEMYTDLAGKVDRVHMRKLFEEFAREEVGHREKLRQIKKGKLLLPAEEKVMDMKIAEYLEDVEPSAVGDYVQALTLAMKEEKAAFRMYTDLAEAATDENVRAMLLGLAQEEAKHKLRFEIEYDEYVLAED
jgi:rubrerythrin